MYIRHDPGLHACILYMRASDRSNQTADVLIGVMGYLRFGTDTQDDIILNYSSVDILNNYGVAEGRQKLMASGAIGITICLVLSFPLLLFPCRGCFHTLIRPVLKSPGCRGLSHWGPNVYFVAETLGLTGAAFGLAQVIPNLATVFGLTGEVPCPALPCKHPYLAWSLTNYVI